MHSIQFWKSWSAKDRIMFWISILCVLGSVFFSWTSWLASPAPVITYDHFQQIQRIEVPSHSFSVGLVNLVVPADSYLIFENIFGSKLQPNVLALYIFLGALTFSFLFFITITTTLTRYWFLIGMGLAMLFLASLRFETMGILGLTSKVITVALVLFF